MSFFFIDLKELEEKQDAAISMAFTFTEIPDTRKLLVENIPDHMKKDHIKIYFRLLSEDKVELVEMLSPTKAIITFQTSSGECNAREEFCREMNTVYSNCSQLLCSSNYSQRNCIHFLRDLHI